MAMTAAAAARHAAVRALPSRAPTAACMAVDHALGQQRIGAAGLGGLDGAGEHAHADQELLLAGR